MKTWSAGVFAAISQALTIDLLTFGCNTVRQNLLFPLGCTLALLGSLIAGAAEPADTFSGTWKQTLQQAAFVKDGLERFRHPQYQYECLGLGGTVRRVGYDGFNVPGACALTAKGGLKHLPYLSYQYWWDQDGHRHLPFDLTGDYGDRSEEHTSELQS